MSLNSNANAIRGIKVGSGPAGDMERGPAAPSQDVSYYCAQGHETKVAFADEDGVEIPVQWTCTRCGWDAGTDLKSPPPAPSVEVFKSHLDYVKERRSETEGEKLLGEALESLRERGVIK